MRRRKFLLLVPAAPTPPPAPPAGGTWKLIPEKARSSGVEIDVELPVAYRAELVSLRIRTVNLIGDFSVGSWAAGVRPLKVRE